MTGGSERLRVSSGGDVGIGTDNPDRHFHVKGTDNIQESLRIMLGGICMIEFQDSNTTTGNQRYGAVGNNGVVYATTMVKDFASHLMARWDLAPIRA